MSLWCLIFDYVDVVENVEDVGSNVFCLLRDCILFEYFEKLYVWWVMILYL